MGESPVSARSDRPTGGCARYVGRVGGLAFALGIGAAVVSGAAVASAETSDAGTSGSTSASTSVAAGPSATSSDGAGTSQTQSVSETDNEPSATPDGADEDVEGEDVDQDTDEDVEEDVEEGTDEDAEEDVDEVQPVATAARVARSATSTTAAQEDAQDAAQTQAVRAAAEPDEPTFWEKLFSNKTPTLNHIPGENTSIEGQVVGSLHPDDPDSARLTYTATRPTHGTVVIDGDGNFRYTPGTSFAGQDSFQVTVSDAYSGFHVHGAAGLLNLFTFGLLGSSGHRTTETVFIGQERATVVTGLNSPVDFKFLPDGRILVAEKGGAIRVVQNGTLLAQPAITVSVRTELERGIGGLAVDPNFASNGRIYVSYIASANNRNTLSRFTMTGNTATFDRVLLQSGIDSALNHHGGALDFGPDNKLYWGVGDNNTGSNSQNLSNIHGKILRLNTDGSIPSDNPLISGARSHIYAYGLRNPFRLTFTPTGELLVADVGGGAFEEVNKILPGRNYGWPSAEGVCTSACTGKTDPIYSYARGSGAAITSVTVYMNKVFIADTVQGFIRVLTCTPEYTSCGNAQTFDPDAGATVVLAEGPDGALYQLTYSPGELVRIQPADPVSAARAV